ncbi:LPS export ABC transporter permease LptG [candidate division KSB1 bacterium]|nr:LPS export ABC transporter permease LptG [candidate division KSB1 bacterium]MBL7094158.1 LPS export ABC transporter permease LptG [candidate division KSB1 bacterium]
MKILDNYLLKQFLGTLIFALIAFTAIFIIIDLIEFLDKIIDHNVGFTIVFKYYVYYLPFIFILTLPVATLLASLFSVGQLARFNEITAMRASGLSNYRILSPLVIGGIFISLIAMYAGETLVPYANQQKKDVYQTYVKKNTRAGKRKTKNIQLQIDENQWLIVGFFDVKTNTAFKVSIEEFRNNSMTQRIDAPKMIWQDTTWLLEEGYQRQFKNNVEETRSFQKKELKNINFKPEDIARVQKKAEEMSYLELKRFIEEIIRTGGNPDRWLVELYLKISFPFANLIIILFGAPLASRKTRSGTAISFGISLLICFLYFGVIKLGQSLGHNGTLPPLFAAWLGNMLFGLGAVYILVKSN